MKEKIKEIMFDLFDTYEESEQILDALRSLASGGDITEEEYDYCTNNWEELLVQWENQ